MSRHGRFGPGILIVTVLTCPALRSSPPQESTTQDVVAAFEARLRGWPKDRLAERDQAIRAFFAGLQDSKAKIAAIAMTDSRYVYAIPRPLAGELLGALFKDADLEVRLRAAHALGYNRLAGDHYDGIVALLKEVDDEHLVPVIYAMGHAGDARFLPHLRLLQKHRDGKIRAQAVFALRVAPLDDVLGDVMALWNDPHEQVRYDLLSFLDLATKEGLARMLQRLEDPSPHVGTAAVDYLGRSGQAALAKNVADMVADTNPYVRGKALEAVGNLQARAYVDLVAGRFQDAHEDLYVRRMVLAMAPLGEARHLPLVRAMLRDEDVQVCNYAAQVIVTLQNRQDQKAK